MKKLIIAAFVLAPMAIFAQSAERQVIASTGGYATATGLQVSSTVGETATATGTSSNIIITQGFQQPNGTAVGIKELNNGLSVNVYPNPASNDVVLEIDAKSNLMVNATVYDMEGKTTGVSVSNLKVNGTLKQTLDISELTTGNYLISFTDENTTLGTVRIQKVN